VEIQRDTTQTIIFHSAFDSWLRLAFELLCQLHHGPEDAHHSVADDRRLFFFLILSLLDLEPRELIDLSRTRRLGRRSVDCDSPPGERPLAPASATLLASTMVFLAEVEGPPASVESEPEDKLFLTLPFGVVLLILASTCMSQSRCAAGSSRNFFSSVLRILLDSKGRGLSQIKAQQTVHSAPFTRRLLQTPENGRKHHRQSSKGIMSLGSASFAAFGLE
jgi:hypothetical protein